ncbi:MAG TPA: nitroreductase family protein [Sedimentisphaerales bacterium]|nr:nitroreductase family protein [Sedimentisphaerales bacterium]
MELYEAIKKRYSCRSYQDKPVEKEKLDRILEAARLAPSARNCQDWRFVIVTDKKLKASLLEKATSQQFLANSTIIAACSVNSGTMSCGQPVAAIDVAIALEHIALAATAEGLATCWIGSFKPDGAREVLGIPKSIVVVELMGLGYPADRQPTPKRMKLDEIVCHNRWTFPDPVA